MKDTVKEYVDHQSRALSRLNNPTEKISRLVEGGRGDLNYRRAKILRERISGGDTPYFSRQRL